MKLRLRPGGRWWYAVDTPFYVWVDPKYSHLSRIYYVRFRRWLEEGKVS